MARRRTARGLQVDIEGIDELVGALKRGERDLPKVYRAALEGEGGEAIASQARMRVPRWTGSLAASIKVRKAGPRDFLQAGLMALGGKAGAVTVGSEGKHPRNGMSLQSVGTWVESGTKAHTIGKGDRTNTAWGHRRRGGLKLSNGQFVSGVNHPGTRGRRVMSQSLRAAQWEVEAAIEDELRRRSWMSGSE